MWTSIARRLWMWTSSGATIMDVNVDCATIMDVDVERSRGDGCELERSAASGDERNRPQRRPRDDNGWRRRMYGRTTVRPIVRMGRRRFANRRPRIVEMTFVVAVSTLGRTVVRPYIAPRLIPRIGWRRFARSSYSIVVAAGDYVRTKTPLRSVFTLTSIAPTPLTSLFAPLMRRLRLSPLLR
jgi:hypothetical protein